MNTLFKNLLYFSLCTVAVILLTTASFDASADPAAMAAAAAGASPGVVAAMLAAAGGAGIQQLRELRNVKSKEANDLLDKHPKDKRLPDAIAAQVDGLIEECLAIDQRIKREQQVLDLRAEEHFKNVLNDRGPQGVKNESRIIFGNWLRGGDRAVSAEQWIAYRNAIPEGIRNTMSTTTGSEGGNTVQSDVAARLIELLKEYGGMREVAEILRTEGGNPLSFPSSDGTAETGELVAENASATSADPTFGTVGLNTFKYGSKIVAVPIELLQDGQIDIEAFVLRRLRDRLGRITNAHFTTGTGSGQPRGIVTGAAAGVTLATGNTTSFTYDGIVDLFHSVDPAYRKTPKSGFMTSDTGVRQLRKVKDSQNRPIFVPGYETTIPGASGSAPDLLLGAPLFVNNDVAVPAANARSMVYGDLSKYIIRDVMAMTMFRFTDSVYASKGQVGFLAWMRSGGNLIDTTAVKALIQSAT